MPTPPDSPSRRPARQATSATTAILVLGMHRSGTSAVARMLNLCGADLGRDLLPPKQDNERGFWENSALLALHERFLDEAGLHWHDLACLPDDWRDGAAARHFVAALPETLARQFDASPLFLVKDPRLSLLAPLWIEVLERRAVRPVFVITVRHPDEVAASLAKRDGFSAARSHLLWLQHLLEAEQATRGHRRVFVHYERVLADWRGELERIAATLELTWPDSSAQAGEQIAAFISPSLRHHGGGTREPAAPMPAIVQEAYAIASAAAGAAAADPLPSSAFDAVAATFEQVLRLTGPLIRDLSDQKARADEDHAGEIERARATIDDFAAQVEQARKAHESRDRTESELRVQVEALGAEIERAREGFTAKEREIAHAAEVVALKDREITRAAEVIALKDREIEAARRSIDGFIDELAQARTTVTQKEHEIDSARASIDGIVRELAQARAAFAEKEREIDAARGNIDALAGELDQARALIDARATQLDAARDNMNGLAAQIERAREGFAAKEAELDAARGNIDTLVAEIGRAREAHDMRDALEAALQAEIAALRGSRWFRLGRKLGLIDRKRP